ncbi:MAG: lysine-sensitive aspartokinase 3 [Gemmatimonadaceae bacterium]|nr:lysine-sensitive aspartokinase 3 [Gemmatimonadaceae bacterium]NUO95801.1 lysine-sensitive aspartokinase 3 [Gemmatimonadaceae bacterium]NUP72517.1 lysine-sensitive aspartokinase 3 [Gemmatimonadaceae bacterium]NUS34408.1 lysine-sensitive aspartokinase 3 [Gemmatimonadaceae bacterium]NUS47798.1 lysine-sensitive aspartokinase 3 [Gemmatimonadaceae bacterium]
MIVCKFGGTSVGDADAIARAATIIDARRARQPVVVVSALGGATNQLLQIAEQAAKGQLIGALRAVEGLRDRHLAETQRLLTGDDADEVCTELSAMFDELAALAEALRTLGDLTPRSLDAIASLGEQLSSVLVVAAFRQHGLPAEHLDARQVMITDANFTRAEPQTDAIGEAAQRLVMPLVRAGKIPVMGGFIGSSAGGGVTTTLGRGGSDYSASLVGAALQAEAIEIWTDVDGMLTADPRVVEGARLIERIGFEEASELASFGAKVLHPNTIAPAVMRGIPVWVLNSRRPEGTGTLIAFDAPRRSVTAIAGKSGVTLVKVRSPRMLLTEGFMRTLFEVFARHATSVDVVATSEVSVSVTIDDTTNLEALVVDLRALGDVTIERNRGIVSVVGNGLADGGAAMSQALAAIGDLHVHMLSLSSSRINLTVVVDGEQVAPAMRRLHDAFFAVRAR